MQIDTQPLQVNARCLNVPRVLYGVGGSAVSFSDFDMYIGYSPWSNTQNVRDGGWNVVGKQLSSPKSFNSWAVIDFVADKLDMDQIRDRVRALSSCCQQLGKFFYGCNTSQFANFDSPRHGYDNSSMTQIDTHFLLLQELPFPLSRSNGAIPTFQKRYSFFKHLCYLFLLFLESRKTL